MGDVNLEIKLMNLEEKVEILDPSSIQGLTDRVDNLENDLSEQKDPTISGSLANQIEEVKTDNAEWLKQPNLFDKNSLQVGAFNSDGTLATYENWRYGYISVNGGVTYKCENLGFVYGGCYCVWLDNSKNFISVAFARDISSPQIVIAPSNAKYLGISLSASPENELDIFSVSVYSKSNVELTNELSRIEFGTYTGTTLVYNHSNGHSYLQIPTITGKNVISVMPVSCLGSDNTNIGLNIHELHTNQWGDLFALVTDAGDNAIPSHTCTIKYLAI